MNTSDERGVASMLARAQQLARNPGIEASSEQLLSAASDLVAWGDFAEAEELLCRLDAVGLFPSEAARLRRMMKHFAKLGPEFEEKLLVGAIRTARDPRANPEKLADAVNSLLVWGSLDEADLGIGRMERIETLKKRAASMKAASRQLRRSGILSSFSPIGGPETAELNRPYEAILANGASDSDRLVIAFTGADRKFWLSLHVLYHYLRKLNVRVLYLHDHSGAMFLNGLSSVASGYNSLIAMLKETRENLGIRQCFVMAFSAGGFVGLKAAADINADGYLGFGVRTDLSDGTELPRSRYVDWAVKQCSQPELLINLRSYLEGRDYPRRIEIISAEGAKHDVAHAENLRGLPNVRLKYLANYNHHNVMPGLIARGMLGDVFTSFVDGHD